MRQGRIISRRSLELRLAYKAALVLRLSAEVVALRATLSSAPSGHLLSKEGFQMCASRDFYMPASPASRRALHGVSPSPCVPTVLELLFACTRRRLQHNTAQRTY